MTFCECPTIVAVAVAVAVGVAVGVYHCSTCRLPVPDPDDESRPSRVRKGDPPTPMLLFGVPLPDPGPMVAAMTRQLCQALDLPPPPAPPAGEALSSWCPGGAGAHVFGPLGTNGWRCSGCGLTLTEETLRALGATELAPKARPPEPPKPAPFDVLGPGFWAAVRAAEKGGA